MKLRDKDAVLKILNERRGWLTPTQIARGLGINPRTARKLIRGESLRPEIMNIVASAVGEKTLDIAEWEEK